MRFRTLIFITTLPGLLLQGLRAYGAEISRAQIIAQGQRTADAQLAALKGPVKIDWAMAVMYAGVAEFSPLSKQKEASGRAILEMGAKVSWSPPMRQKEPFNADDFCIGQTFLDASESHHDPSFLGPMRQRADALTDHLKTAVDNPNNLTWSWCDALFMAPPVLARLSMLTGAPKYRNAMDSEWWKATSLLYDPTEHLFYRDSRFTDGKRLTKNGRKVFWARGNGWVVAGLARILTYLPQDYPSRGRYLRIYGEMIGRLATLQSPDGTWPPSLLDPGEYPCSEFSGTALICYATAWGVNQGLLDKQTYLPVAARAWAALLAARRHDALPGYVQSVADSPGCVQRNATQPYATGAFLLAAAQLAELAPFSIPPAPTLTDFPPPPVRDLKTESGLR